MATNLIEEATKRLQELEKAGIKAAASPAAIPAAAPHVVRPTRPSPSAVPPAAPAKLRNLDFARLQANGFLTPLSKESKLVHEFRLIKRPLIKNAMGKGAAPIANGNLIMVTSALPGEGKSFVSLNLAMSIAMEVDCRVLLVDADVIRPTVPKLLNLHGEKGLMDVLTEPDLEFGDVILRTNVERLSLVLAGRPHSGAHELLASDEMGRLTEEIASRYPDRIVIFDSPPLLATTESRVLASRAGQVVMVVEAQRTTHATIEAALATVEACPVVMTLLNKAPQSEAGAYYGDYGYGGG